MTAANEPVEIGIARHPRGAIPLVRKCGLADLNPGELEHLLPDVWKKEQAAANTQPSTSAA